MLADVALPAWMVYTGGASMFVVSVGQLWRKVFNPIRKTSNRLEEAVPFFLKFMEVFKEHPEFFNVLDSIAAEFKTNHGSTLKDDLNKLRDSIADIMVKLESAKTEIAADRRVDHIQRNQIQKQVLVLDRLTVKVETITGLLLADDADKTKIAARLLTAQSAVDQVADDLNRSHERADAVTGGAGEAADAASRSGWDGIERRQPTYEDYRGPERRRP